MSDTTTLATFDQHDLAGTPVMRMLAAGLPLALLCDLTDPQGPSSTEIYDREGSPERAWWLAG